MKSDLLSYLKSYSSDPFDVDRLIVSAFLDSFNLENLNNLFLNKYYIRENDNDFNVLKDFKEICEFREFEDLIKVFEFVISPQEKIVTGAVYTPKQIRENIVENCLNDTNDIENITICDPACGCSGFLLTASQFIYERTKKTYFEIFRDNIYGLDIQEYSIMRSKILLTLFAISQGEVEENFEFNLFECNALSFQWPDHIDNFQGFHAIVGNPPYVCSRNIDDESKSLLKNWSVCSTGHPDLYIPFFQIGISLLREGGKLGYITMNTFFKSVNGRALRSYFQEISSSLNIIDFGAFQVFDSKSTYTCICLFKNTPSTHLNYVKLKNLGELLENNFTSKKISYESLCSENGWNLEEQQLIDKIEGIGKPLGKKFKSRNGIATLKNKVYIFNPINEDEQFYYLMSEGIEYRIEKNCCVDIVNPNKLIKLDSIETLRKKIILPYSLNNNQINIIDENQFSNNYPNAYRYLVSKKDELAKRDKGKGAEYNTWFQYGRNQSLEPFSYKLLFPHISPYIPNYVINNEPNLLFVNGLAIVSEDLRDLEYLRKVLSSRIFWFYIVNTSKPYGSGYYSLSRNYIKNFGIYDFTEEQINYLIDTDDQHEIDLFLERLYEINLDHFNKFRQKLESEAA
ncbi:Eco57I restriction-modification methylase domain-containing protein [Salegentibacter sp. UBA1130]|uniref:Eco57I restriction-modification methylase domain-containing protein n=1 Tax=Salegentibacter sp. UBA1130 TaxID=1947451 RepID=UPI00257E7708|nr:N-6 DNA methylase [Salegentibacter sp. UBA1130]